MREGFYDKTAEAARLRYADYHTTLALSIIGVIAIGAVVGMLWGNYEAHSIFTAVLIPLG